jgi:hypothetical protein
MDRILDVRKREVAIKSLKFDRLLGSPAGASFEPELRLQDFRYRRLL